MLFSSIQRQPLVLQEKGLFEFSEYSSISISKKNSCNEDIVKFPKNIHFGGLNSSIYAGLLGARKTTRLERFMPIIDVQKQECLRYFRHVQKCAHAIACLIHLFLDQIYMCCSMKNLKALSDDQQCIE